MGNQNSRSWSLEDFIKFIQHIETKLSPSDDFPETVMLDLWNSVGKTK